MSRFMPYPVPLSAPAASGNFIFSGYAFTPDHTELRLTYRYETGTEFIEVITFPQTTRVLRAADLKALDALVRLLFLLAGVSYYKAFVPETLVCPAFALDAETAEFVQAVYRQGLGEFAYRNQLDLSLNFKKTEGAPPPEAVALEQLSGVLVPVGGGKDSIVTLEALRAQTPTLFVLTSDGLAAEPIAETIRVSGLPSCTVTRRLSTELFELNRLGAYNGHVPVTAILSVIALITAVLLGKKHVVMSNEHSASLPNLTHNGVEINHQYSKSYAFEAALTAYVARYVSPDLSYFSLLRPFSEAAITRKFARLTQYHVVFRSCNAAFRQDRAARAAAWCGNCPKCRFVFLALAPFLDKEQLARIFGANLLADPAQTDGFAELCGLLAYKPFECVGEVEESAALLAQLGRSGAWQDDCVVQALRPQLSATEADYRQLFTPRPGHFIPLEFSRYLDALC